ncbi:asparagine synthase (glutamine-hydrolyzing) [Streptomyces mirabilis]|uniref:asparagine synthase (glutamine-hydrolyzing) n=1 Tax=Streptomyces mirabilis TaxID=68239 RepID=UPI00380C4D2C
MGAFPIFSDSPVIFLSIVFLFSRAVPGVRSLSGVSVMCGIAGVARIDGAALGPETDTLLDGLADALLHRGPDDRELLRHDGVGLAFTRLSLVDPVGGGQPLFSEDGSVVLIANGEVYNHRELAAGLPAGTRMRTQSDCEVLVHLYQRDGLAFLNKVNGMFALVLWDRKRNVLIFARDRFGIKPLFFHRDKERVVFASEIKALFTDPAVPRRVDWEKTLGDPAMNAGPMFTHAPVNTWFEDVDLVPAATIVRIDLADGDTAEHRYWRLPEADADCDASDSELIDAYRDLLIASVRDCATADADLGLFLSGGIDSAAVAALAGRDDLRTFTVLTGATVLNGDAEWGHRAARLLGLPNHHVVFDGNRVPTPEEWKRLLWLTETPLCGPEQYYKYELHRYARQEFPEIKGMLLGAASDEFNGGYSPNMANGGDWNDFLANLRIMARNQSLGQRPEFAHWWEISERPMIKDAFLLDSLSPRDTYDAFMAWKYRSLQQYNVWHEDRTAAGNSIEARVPFLDHRLVELVAKIPAARRPSLLWDKRILRKAMEGILPEPILRRPKVPFYYGEGVRHTYRTFARMLVQQGGALLDEAVSTSRAREFLDADGIRETLRRLEREPESAGIEMALRLVNLGLIERMTSELPPSPGSLPRQPTFDSLVVSDWDRQRMEIRNLVLPKPSVTADGVYALAEETELVSVPAQPNTWYLLVDGYCMYTLDENTEPLRVAVLRALDSVSTVEKIVSDLGCDADDVFPLLEEAVELGVVQTCSTAR